MENFKKQFEDLAKILYFELGESNLNILLQQFSSLQKDLDLFSQIETEKIKTQTHTKDYVCHDFRDDEIKKNNDFIKSIQANTKNFQEGYIVLNNKKDDK